MNLLSFTNKPVMTDIKPFDVNDLEAEIEDVFMRSHAHELVPPVEYAPQPVEDVGRLTALAVMASHERAAEAITRMRETINSLAKQHEQALAELDAMGRLITEAAEKYTTLGTQRSELIARSAQIMADVRQACTDVMAKIGSDELPK